MLPLRLGVETIDNYFTTTFQESTEIYDIIPVYNYCGKLQHDCVRMSEQLHVPQTEYHSAGKAS